MSGTPALRVEGLRAGYDGVAVVRDLDLVVEPGEIVALLGPNGAGKTTSLLTISGLLPALSGNIELAGTSIRGMRPHKIARRGLAHVPEERALFQGLTVGENLELGVRGRKSGAAADPLRHTPALRELLSRRAGLLSGGEQQMLALARALQSRPAVLMVDEMSLGLAPRIVHSLLSVLTDVAGEYGCGILLVEQHVEMALAVANRAYVLAHGHLVLHEDAATLRKDKGLLQSSYLGEASLANP